MKETVPELFDGQPDLLFQLNTIMSPGYLVSQGVKVRTPLLAAQRYVSTLRYSLTSALTDLPCTSTCRRVHHHVSTSLPRWFQQRGMGPACLQKACGADPVCWTCVQFNFAEAVNFATPDWFPHGNDCINNYKVRRMYDACGP